MSIEGVGLTGFRVNLARRYFRFLGIEAWVAKWCHANRELASRVGLLDVTPRERGARRPRRA